MSRSKFPEEVDVFPELFDLPFDKVVSATRLTALKSQESLNNDEQNELSRLSLELKDYLITPETWNLFCDALHAVELFFNQNVQGFLNDKQEIWDSYIKNFKYVGKWKAGTNYVFQNLVTGESGDLYICKTDNLASTANKPPLNNSNEVWQLISKKGDKGDIGLSLIYKGDWNATTEYKMGEAVCYGRVDSYPAVTYYALVDNVGKDPSQTPDTWRIWNPFYIGTNSPNGAGPGLHFIKVL